MNKFKHIIFDLDGTLYNTDNSIFEMWKFLLEREFPEFNIDSIDFNIMLGISTEDAMNKLGLPYSDEFDYMFTNEYIRFCHLITLYDGVKEMLIKLIDAGYKLGIVSSRPYREYDKYLKPLGIDSLFTSKVLKDDTKLHKPNPDPLLTYMNKNNLQSEECIYIGDMPTDILCARNANVTSVLLQWDLTRTFDVKADYVFTSIAELESFFLG